MMWQGLFKRILFAYLEWLAKRPGGKYDKWVVPHLLRHVPFDQEAVRQIYHTNTAWSTWCGDTVDGLIATIEEQTNRANCLEDALRELVALKDLKDTQGKTFEYLERQPMAWQNARLILGMKP